MYGPVPGGMCVSRSFSGIPDGAMKDHWTASFCRNSESALVRWNVTVPAASFATTPRARLHVLACFGLSHTALPTIRPEPLKKGSAEPDLHSRSNV